MLGHSESMFIRALPVSRLTNPSKLKSDRKKTLHDFSDSPAASLVKIPLKNKVDIRSARKITAFNDQYGALGPGGK